MIRLQQSSKLEISNANNFSRRKIKMAPDTNIHADFEFQITFQENYGKQAILKIYRVNGIKYGVGTIYDTLGEYNFREDA